MKRSPPRNTKEIIDYRIAGSSSADRCNDRVKLGERDGGIYGDSLGSMTRKRLALLPCSSCGRSHGLTTFLTTAIMIVAAHAEHDRENARGVA